MSTGRGLIALVTGLVVLTAACVYWFAFRGDDSSAGAAGATSTNQSTTLPDNNFKVAGVPFTFSYPGKFAPGKETTGFVWIAGISPVDILDLRRVDDREYSAQGMNQVMGDKLNGQQGVKVLGSGTDSAGGKKVVTFTVQSGTTTPLRSKLVYFSAGGSSWQLECQSQSVNRAAIEAACAQALATLDFA